MEAEPVTNPHEERLAELAHEVNNPVQGILGMAELLLDEEDPAKIKEYTLDIVNYSKHIANVVHDLVGYVRTNVKRESALDLHERLLDAVKMVRRLPHFGCVEVHTQFHPIPPLQARRVEIDQMFLNLINNAVQAMKGQGRLLLATQSDGGTITVRISDNGCGIPDAVRPQIFQPFFTTKEPGKGDGMGLSIVQRIAAKYGGTITVQSEVGKGTTFILQFPQSTHIKEGHNGRGEGIRVEREARPCLGGR